MSHSPTEFFSTLIAPGVTASALTVGDIISGPGIPGGSRVLSINYLGNGQYGVEIDQTPVEADVYAAITNGHGGYSTPSGASGTKIAFGTSLQILRPSGPSTTVSFKENVKGWVSFKTFVPENALSLANNYYSLYEGKFYQHYVETVDRNNFYGVGYNSSVNVLLNDLPGTIKTFNTINYEGSQSKTLPSPELIINGDFSSGSDGWKLTGGSGSEQWIISSGVAQGGVSPNYGYMAQSNVNIVEGRKYQITYDIVVASTGGQFILANHTTVASTLNSSSANNNVNLINETVVGTHTVEWIQGPGSVGKIRLWNDAAFDGSVSNISVKELTFTEKNGWFATNITTDKQKGSLSEFIEKEGKWFNYIKGVVELDVSLIDFSAFNLQGIGVISSINGLILSFNGSINVSLQVGDVVYSQFNQVVTKAGIVTFIKNNSITIDNSGTIPNTSDFALFAKNDVVNTSSLLGYYADVKFENNSTNKIELFSIGSEVSESSK